MVVLGLSFLAALWPTEKLRIPSAVIEIILGMLLAFSLTFIWPAWRTEGGHEWILFIATLGAIAHIFLAGTETRLTTFNGYDKQLPSLGKLLGIGFLSFVTPFVLTTLFCFFYVGWSFPASVLAGLALSETSIAIVYVVLVEGRLNGTLVGRIVLAVTFLTNIIVAIALGAAAYFVFPPQVRLGPVAPQYFLVLLGLFLLAAWFLRDKYKTFVTKDIGIHFAWPLAFRALKLSLLLIFSFALIAEFGGIAAIFPAYLLGFILGPAIRGTKPGEVTPEMARFRTFHFGLFAPFLFIYAGMRISYEAFIAGLAIIFLLFLIKVVSKYFVAFFGMRLESPKMERKDLHYSSGLLATGLTLGTVIGLVGLQTGVINELQFSILEAAILLSAIVPTIIAEKLFRPEH